jgi:hypothetical protein
LATTNPDAEFQVAANSTGYLQGLPTQGAGFAVAISIASTTTEKGLTGSAAGVEVFPWYG